MKKDEFLTELKDHLVGVSKDDVAEIMQDYEEHFKAGKKDKRSENEIARSLGNPKLIAREIRMELSDSRGVIDLKSDAIETWVAIKKFSVHLFVESRDKLDSLITAIRKKNVSSAAEKDKKSKSRNDVIKIFFSLAFNLLFFIWFWVALFFTIIGFFIASVGVIVSGAIMIAFSIFALIGYKNELTADILFSVLFAGIGTTILGGLLTALFERLTRLFFRLTNKYIELNMRLVKK